VQLTRNQKVRWKLYHPPGLYSAIKISKRNGFDPLYLDLSRFTCTMCGVTKYYKYWGDEDGPQYTKIKKETHSLCHTCWHTYTRVSKCRVCELNEAQKIARRRARIQAKLAGDDSTQPVKTGKTTWVPAVREQVRVRRGIGLSNRRRSNKDKKDRGSRRRRSSRVS
jgi:ribosomal protein L44E